MPEHTGLVGKRLAVDHLVIAGGENAMPEQGHLFPQRCGGGGHAVEPVFAGGLGAHHARQFRVEAAHEVVADPLLFARIEQLIDGRLISQG